MAKKDRRRLNRYLGRAGRANPTDLSRIHISAYALSDRGQRRASNQDQWIILDLTTGARGIVAEALEHDVGRNGTLLAVADGLGGAPGGELASSLAIESLLRDLRGRTTAPSALHLYYEAINRANQWIWNIARQDATLRGMGATLTTALIYHRWAYVAQVGDSRAYLIRNGQCHQITEDQSLLDSLVSMGQLTAEEARTAGVHNLLLQALGTNPDVQIAITEVELCNEDLLILTTDGLFRLVTTEELCQVLMESTSLQAACEELITLANDRGGPDNITVVAARITGISQHSPDRDHAMAIHRLTVFDPGIIFQRHPELSALTLSRVREKRTRFYLLIGLLLLLAALVALRLTI